MHVEQTKGRKRHIVVDVLGCLLWFMLPMFMTQKVEYVPLNERISGIHLFRSSVRPQDTGGLLFLI